MKILVADDNFNNRRLLADILESQGYDVVMAVDGLETLEGVRVEQPHLIILDINMPNMNGFEVCEVLKSDEATAGIPIIMLTALADVDHRVQGLELGADDYLSKPFDPRELVERVRTRLRSKNEHDELRHKEELIRQTFSRFVPAQVVDALLKDTSRIKLGGQLQEVTVFFADLENFTSISERTEPEALLTVLNAYHTLIVGVIQKHAGTVDKFMGDAVMALYNTPLEQSDHAQRAVATAFEIRHQLDAFYQQFDVDFHMKINFGIHTGMAVVGNVGAPDIMDFTAVGDTVNLAARLQDLSQGGRILISESTYERVADAVDAVEIGALDVKGRASSVVTYEVVAINQPSLWYS